MKLNKSDQLNIFFMYNPCISIDVDLLWRKRYKIKNINFNDIILPSVNIIV